MTVRKLMEKLRNVDPDMPVSIVTMMRLQGSMVYNFRAMDVSTSGELFITNFPNDCFGCKKDCSSCEIISTMHKELDNESEFYNTRDSSKSK